MAERLARHHRLAASRKSPKSRRWDQRFRRRIRAMATVQEPPIQQIQHKRYRTLAVVKQEAVTRIEKQLEDSVFVWPHLLVREFMAAVLMTVVLTITSLAINAPLRDHANSNLTPNPAKAPWYFL